MSGIPVLSVFGENIAAAWEDSLIELYKHGCDIKTQYDKPEDPPSKDATMIITIDNPFAEPMIHLDFPGGPEDLQEYMMEVVEGTKNHCLRDPNDPNDTRWQYTYNSRLFGYDCITERRVHECNGECEIGGHEAKVYDQIDMVAEKLAISPYTRRAQAITWKVWEDNTCEEAACLQSIWCRITEEDGVPYLNTNIRFRSNDAYKASFMNMFALAHLQKLIAEKVSEKSGREVKLGRYVHMADSYHLYGSYFEEFEGRFLKALETRNFEQRTAHYEDWKEMMEEARPALLKKAKEM